MWATLLSTFSQDGSEPPGSRQSLYPASGFGGEVSRAIKEVTGNSITLARVASVIILAMAASLSLAVPTGAVEEDVGNLLPNTGQEAVLDVSVGVAGPAYQAKAAAPGLPAGSHGAKWTVGTGAGPEEGQLVPRSHSTSSEVRSAPAAQWAEEPCIEENGITCISLDEAGILTEDVTAQSVDRLAEVAIPGGTMALTAEGVPLTWMKIGRLEATPSLAGDHAVVSQIYNLQPEGTTFDNPAVITLLYSDDDVPAGAREDRLVLAAWSSFLGVWVELESILDAAGNSLSAELTYLTAVAVLAGNIPASFQLSQLTIVPEEVEIDEAVVVSALIENTGDLTDVLRVEFRRNGELFDSKEVTLDGHNGITVSSDQIVTDEPGRYTASINDLARNFTVREPVVVPLPPPAEEIEEADIQFTDLTIRPAVSEVGQAVTVGIVATNHGEIEGIHSVALLINGIFTDSELIQLAPGERYVVTFVVTERASGSYSVVVERWGNTQGRRCRRNVRFESRHTWLDSRRCRCSCRGAGLPTLGKTQGSSGERQRRSRGG